MGGAFPSWLLSTPPAFQALLLARCRRRLRVTAPLLSTVTASNGPSSHSAQERVFGSGSCLAGSSLLPGPEPLLLALEPLAVLRDEPAQHRRVVAREVLDMRGMAPRPAGEQPVLGQVCDEIRAGGDLPLRQRAQDIGPHKALGRLQLGKAAEALVLRIVAPVVLRTIVAAFAGGMRRGFRQAALAQLLDRLGAREIDDVRAGAVRDSRGACAVGMRCDTFVAMRYSLMYEGG